MLLVLLAASTFARSARTVHVFVAVCDNANQGIVPVPAALGNGQDPQRNLYWGAMFGVKTFLGKSSEWEQKTITTAKRADVLDHVLFKHKASGTLLLAEAFDGAAMRQCIQGFFNALAGHDTLPLVANGASISFGGAADLVCFVGHDGLMDIDLGVGDVKTPVTGRHADAMVLCCYSASYFGPHVARSNGDLLVSTYGLMAPEAYVLDAAVRSWVTGKQANAAREAAAQAYHAYQKCGVGAARKLFGAKASP
ncbi:MAG: hypothetical protein IPJ76_02200 [Flavobacteriales bacterium]|nr:MAG: hypothetical protein IPJ76_02200 [Flavobacteriales bacterium]